jgi:hypothetical protein
LEVRQWVCAATVQSSVSIRRGEAGKEPRRWWLWQEQPHGSNLLIEEHCGYKRNGMGEKGDRGKCGDAGRRL